MGRRDIGAGPLAGLRVIEAGTYFSAPFAGMMLSDLGASVIKVEPPGKGDPFRTFARPTRGVSSMFINVNRGKESSVALDLKDAGDRNALIDLVRDADVFIHNWRPGVAESLGLADAVLAAANPTLIRVAISGFGPTGPYAGQPAFDALMQAQSGLAVYEEENGAPRLNRTSLSDKVTSVMAAQSILAAVIARSATGEGQLLELGMLDALAYFNYPDMFQEHTFLDDEAPTSVGGTPSLLVPTADGHIVVQPMTGAQLKRVCVACDRPEWVDELKGCDPAQLRTEFHRRLSGALLHKPTAFWVERFLADDVPVAPAMSLTDHLADAQVVHNELYEIDEHPEPLGRVRRVRYPTRFTGTPVAPKTSVPTLGSSDPRTDG